MRMATLTRELRRSLENTVRAARRAAEAGAQKAIEELGVNHHEPWPSMTPAQRELRNRLRAHGRQLGDRRDERRGVQAIDHLTTECAYEHWHRMLFARFLAEAELLIEPKSGVAISLAECQELARAEGRDWLELAAEYAQRMLPQIFRTGDSVLEVNLPPETRSALEDLMKALPGEMFFADDSLGWVYQYWQADRKEEINRSKKKIGAEELPAVTQLFTEDYMVFFLLHNTLGAWWAGKVLAENSGLAATAGSEDELRSACALGGVEWTYLRFVRDGDGPWRPAAGSFDDWPKAAKDFTLLDPCMGSGHFLVFALPMLAALRAREEGIAPDTAILAVLRDNLFGLEIDLRCTQIAAFNLALAAWRRVGYRALPALHIACSGLSLGVTKAEWLKLAERAAAELPVPPKRDLLGTDDNLFSDAMQRGFERIYELFARAPWIGSLIEPRGAGGDLVEYGFADLEPILARVIARDGSAELAEMAVAAQGAAKATEILSNQFTLVATNVPYLGRHKQDDVLRKHCEDHFFDARGDLASCVIARLIKWITRGGVVAVVSPQAWLFQPRYKLFRGTLLSECKWNFLVQLGEGGFESAEAAGAFTNLLILSPGQLDPSTFPGLDLTMYGKVSEKRRHVAVADLQAVDQQRLHENPDSRILIERRDHALPTLSEYAECYQGLRTGDKERFVQKFWDFPRLDGNWEPLRTCGSSSRSGEGSNSHTILWQNGRGDLHRYAQETRDRLHDMHESGQRAWGRTGVSIAQVRTLEPSIYCGERFDNSLVVIFPKEPESMPALIAYCNDVSFREEIRKLDKSLNVTNATFLKVPFDIAHWSQVANRVYPAGNLQTGSNDPTNWLFPGNPKTATNALQAGVARLVGYVWPRQSGSSFLDCPALKNDGLERYADADGIVTLSSVKGEQPAEVRLTTLLGEAWGAEWSATKLASLLAQAGLGGKTLDDWLRDGFFEQHCALFQQRPFVWHIWDGRRDGFHALVNYHRLAAPDGEGRRTLEKLLYTYLGDWIDRQRSDQKAGVEGADARVAAAEQLKTELTNVLAGEPPYDLFVRWKPLTKQPIGWEPDINDGVRMNIRPFMAAKPLGARAKGACILRATPKIKWEKDRGNEPQRAREDFPWFWGWDETTENFEGTKTFDGNRWNDLHYTRSFKEAARGRGKK
jgi:hypothetical protein